MPHWKKCMDSKYLGSWDLNGKEPTVTIAKVEAGEVTNAQGTQKKPLISFEKGSKQLVANSTICKTIARLYGNNTDDWVGKSITLYVTEVSAFGDIVEAIRVKPTVPK